MRENSREYLWLEAFENYIEFKGPQYRLGPPAGFKRRTPRPEPANEGYFKYPPVILIAESKQEVPIELPEKHLNDEKRNDELEGLRKKAL